jgi:2-amino-4-hydroxy-6-hydroxymethyldihydropteridine diphosphokinase
MLRQTPDIEVTGVSDLLEAAPLLNLNQPKYINTVAKIKTLLSPENLFSKLQGVENSLGRTRGEKWGSRTIDLDLLLFGSQIINSPRLTVPHPQMHLRSFVLKGLCQFDAQFIHPVLEEPLAELASRLNGADFVLNPDVTQLVSLAGIIGVGKTTLAKKLSEIFNAKILFEPYDTNPFLPAVYAGNKDLALDSQLYFLTNRISQLNPGNMEKGRIVISDYVFNKEMIYAKRLLDDRQFVLYQQMYNPLCTRVTQPVLVIYLTDSAENCLDRIHRRSRPYEQKIQPAFLENLAADHEQLFTDWKICPVIRIQKSKFDCMKVEHINRLVKQIKAYVAGL